MILFCCIEMENDNPEDNIWAMQVKKKTFMVIDTAASAHAHSDQCLLFSVIDFKVLREEMCNRKFCAQSGKSSPDALDKKGSTVRRMDSEVSDQTARKRRLIWVFAERNCLKVNFLTSNQ